MSFHHAIWWMMDGVGVTLAMADIIGELGILFDLILSHNLTNNAGTDDRWPSICHDQRQFTIDGYLSSLCVMADIIGTRRLFNGIPLHRHDWRQWTIDRYPSSLCQEQSYGRYPSIVDCGNHGRGILLVQSQENYLMGFCCTTMTDANGQLTDIHHHSAMSGAMVDIICVVTRRLFNGILSQFDGWHKDGWRMADGVR